MHPALLRRKCCCGEVVKTCAWPSGAPAIIGWTVTISGWAWHTCFDNNGYSSKTGSTKYLGGSIDGAYSLNRTSGVITSSTPFPYPPHPNPGDFNRYRLLTDHTCSGVPDISNFTSVEWTLNCQTIFHDPSGALYGLLEGIMHGTAGAFSAFFSKPFSLATLVAGGTVTVKNDWAASSGIYDPYYFPGPTAWGYAADSNSQFYGGTATITPRY